MCFAHVTRAATGFRQGQFDADDLSYSDAELRAFHLLPLFWGPPDGWIVFSSFLICFFFTEEPSPSASLFVWLCWSLLGVPLPSPPGLWAWRRIGPLNTVQNMITMVVSSIQCSSATTQPDFLGCIDDVGTSVFGTCSHDSHAMETTLMQDSCLLKPGRSMSRVLKINARNQIKDPCTLVHRIPSP